MEFDWNIIIALLTGIATAIPLVIKLVQSVTGAVKEKNWAILMNQVIGYMKEAEDLYVNGADKKEWVMGMIEQSAKNINYDLTEEAKKKISDMIDAMCDLSKNINIESKVVEAE